jgi:hypothetical protein
MSWGKRSEASSCSTTSLGARMVTSFMCSHRSPRAAGSEGRRWHRPSRRAISRRLKPLRGAQPCVRARSDLSTAHPVRCLLCKSCSTARTRSTTISLSNSAYVRGNSLFVLLWFSEWQGRDLRRACFQSLRRHIFNGLFTGEEFSDWSTTIVVMAAFDSGQLASLWSLTEVFGSMCLILDIRFVVNRVVFYVPLLEEPQEGVRIDLASHLSKIRIRRISSWRVRGWNVAH